MSTVPRLPSAVENRPANMSTLLAHQPELARAFGELYARFWSHGEVDHPTKETVRIRNARVTDCGY
ncbi:MAG: hypothetical protein AAFP84_18495 [Actinomycetota bacterium]